MDEATEWIEVRRFNDFVEADLVEQFLRDHGLRVQRTGNGAASMGLDRFTSVIDIRLLVPASSVLDAREALEAMATEVQDAPYRGQAPAPEQAPDPDEPKEARRSPRAAFMLALLFPIGGGHFYARSNATGILFALAMLGGFGATVVLGVPTLLFGALLLVPLDAVGAYFAARRLNAGREWSPGKQRAWGTVAIVLAFGAAIGWSYSESVRDEGRTHPRRLTGSLSRDGFGASTLTAVPGHSRARAEISASSTMPRQ